MSRFHVIEAVFLITYLSVFIFYLEPHSPFPFWLTFGLFALCGFVIEHFIKRARSKWDWINKEMDGKLAVLTIIAAFAAPFFIDFMVFSL